MKVEKFEEKLQKVRVEHYYVCDKCNKRIIIKTHNDFDFQFKCNTGRSSTDGGNGILYELNLCEECVMELFRLLRENKYNIQSEEWDW